MIAIRGLLMECIASYLVFDPYIVATPHTPHLTNTLPKLNELKGYISDR